MVEILFKSPKGNVSIHLRSHMNNSSSCLTVISKTLEFGYPGETLALVVHILHKLMN